MSSDFDLALRLQREFEQEASTGSNAESRNDSLQEISSSPSRKRPYSEFDLDGTQQLVHPLWETLDPTPDVFGMFRGFDAKFFQGKLHCVELEWSKRMYSCAGICYQRKNQYGMSCTIRLSEPLLKLRSRKNLVETLLHEMIHAYLFILNVREGNGGHGPNFCRIMTNINKAAGTNITVYHTFHDEVNHYKTHIWRCNGICQHRGPFFGYVRRTANRAPGPNDQWWAHHHDQCGGNFLKVSEPDPVVKKRKGKDATTKATNKSNSNSKIDNPRWGMVKKTTAPAIASRAPTIVVRKPAKKTKDKSNAPTTQLNPDLSAGRSLSNVVGFRDLTGTATKPSSSDRPLSSSNGRTLGTSGTTKPSAVSSKSNPRENVRDIWTKKFSDTSTANKDQKTDAEQKPSTVLTPFQSNWVVIDDDIEIESVVHETVTILDDNSQNANDVIEIDETDSIDDSIPNANDNIETDETVSIDNSIPNANDSSSDLPRQSSDEASIKREIISSFGDDLTDSDIELIDCDYDDSSEPVGGLCDKSITDNLFSFNESTDELNKVHMTDDDNAGNPDKELVSCPVCNIKCERELMSDHLDGCLGITRKIDPRRAVKPPTRGTRKTNKSKTSTVTTSTPRTEPTPEDEEFDRRILGQMETEARVTRSNSVTTNNDAVSGWVPCPVCTKSVRASKINDHLDYCLS